MFKPFFLSLFPGVWVFKICVWMSRKLRPRETNKEKRFKLVSILLSKMFYGHAIFIGGNSQKESRYLSFPPGFIAVASRGYKNWLQFDQHCSHSVFNFYFFGNTIRRQMSWHVLKLDLNSARWMPKLVSYAASTLQSLRATIGPLQDNWSLFHYVIGILGILPYNRNFTLQTFKLFSAYAWLYNAAASPASRLRSAGSLAIIYC